MLLNQFFSPKNTNRLYIILPGLESYNYFFSIKFGCIPILLHHTFCLHQCNNNFRWPRKYPNYTKHSNTYSLTQIFSFLSNCFGYIEIFTATIFWSSTNLEVMNDQSTNGWFRLCGPYLQEIKFFTDFSTTISTTPQNVRAHNR